MLLVKTLLCVIDSFVLIFTIIISVLKIQNEARYLKCYQLSFYHVAFNTFLFLLSSCIEIHLCVHVALHCQPTTLCGFYYILAQIKWYIHLIAKKNHQCNLLQYDFKESNNSTKINGLTHKGVKYLTYM